MLLSLTNSSPYFPSKIPKLKPIPILFSLPQPKPKPETAPKSTIWRISEKLRSLAFVESDSVAAPVPTGPGSAGEIFIPTPNHLPLHRVEHTIDASWSTHENPVPVPGTGIAQSGYLWKAERREATTRMEVPMAAEILLPSKELRRLRGDEIRLEKKVKVGKADITYGIVNGIHERWRQSELVKIKWEDLCRMNMKRTYQILESKTGRLVIWRSGSIIILYRGANYKYPYFTDGDHTYSKLDNISAEPDVDESFMGQEGKALSRSSVYPLVPSPDTSKEEEANSLSTFGNPLDKSPSTSSRPSLVIGVGSPNKFRLQMPGEAQIGEEADRLLDGLGPRFTDWWSYEPLPVDADLLPGKNRNLQGLARSMINGRSVRLLRLRLREVRRIPTAT